MIIKCEKCNKEFYRRPSRASRNQHNYCSKYCADIAKGSLIIKCSNCEKEFKRGKRCAGDRSNQFCSKRCFSEFKIKQNEVECSFCGKKLYRPKGLRDSNKTGMFYCGLECRKAYTEKKNIVKCVICSNDFRKAAADIRRYPVHCCSIKCRSKYNNKRIRLVCPACKKILYKPPSLVNGKKNVFCSVKCHDIYYTTKQLIPCAKCGKYVYKHQCYIKKNRELFCSVQCSAKFYYKESFVETEFEKLIQKIGIKYERNDRIVVGPLELDFWFPSIKFAVEVNGCLHYKPIYGDKALAERRERDRRKRKMCKQLGIKLRTVKPGNCRAETYLPRYKRVVWEIKRLMKND